MPVDENVFFREATLRICSSLNIVEALKSCFDYVKLYIPMNRMYLHIYDADLNLMRLVASARDDRMQEPERILSLPEKGRNIRAAELKADLLKNEVVIRVWNQPDPRAYMKTPKRRHGDSGKIWAKRKNLINEHACEAC